MIVALYSRLPGEPIYSFVVAQQLPENLSFQELKTRLIREHGRGSGLLDKVIPAVNVSDLPDILEHLNVD